jgi:hypothetical protein
MGESARHGKPWQQDGLPQDYFKLVNLQGIIQCGTSICNRLQAVDTAIKYSRNEQGLLLTADLLYWNTAPSFFLLPRDMGLDPLTAAAAVSLVLASVVTACRVQTHEAFKVHALRIISMDGESGE